MKAYLVLDTSVKHFGGSKNILLKFIAKHPGKYIVKGLSQRPFPVDRAGHITYGARANAVTTGHCQSRARVM